MTNPTVLSVVAVVPNGGGFDVCLRPPHPDGGSDLFPEVQVHLDRRPAMVERWELSLRRMP